MDSFSYYEAWDNLKLLHPDFWRPPVFPIIVGVLKEIFGMETSRAVLALFNWGCYAAAMLLLYPVCRGIGVGNRVSCAVVLGSFLLPGLWVMNNIAMAESFSGSLLVALVWTSLKLRDTGRRSWLWRSGLLMATLIFTKPVFVILLPIMAIYWLATLWHRGGELWIAACILAGILAMVTFYGWQLYRFNGGNFGLTYATISNRFYCLREHGLIRPDEIPVDSIRERFRPYYEADPGHPAPGDNLYNKELWHFSWSEKELMVSIALRNHPNEALASIWQRFRDSAFFSQTLSPEPVMKPVYHPNTIVLGEDAIFYPCNSWLYTPIWLSWLLLLAFFIIISRQWIIEKRVPSVEILIGVIFLAGLVTSIVGAQDSWGRLTTPFTPLLIPMSGVILRTAVRIGCRAAITFVNTP